MTESFLCLDLETTGLNPKTDRIIEIGAVRFEQGKQTGVFETFVNPGRLLAEEITELTGIADFDLTDAPDIQDVLPGFLKFAGDLPLLGHSVLFDFSFIKKAAVNQRLTFEREGIDTLKIARKYLQELPSRSLGSLCAYYEIPHQAHRALADAKATAELYQKLWKDFGEQEEETKKSLFNPIPLVYQAKKDSPITKSQKERLYKLLELHKIDTAYDLDKLTKSEASRYTDRILSKYGR